MLIFLCNFLRFVNRCDFHVVDGLITFPTHVIKKIIILTLLLGGGRLLNMYKGGEKEAYLNNLQMFKLIYRPNCYSCQTESTLAVQDQNKCAVNFSFNLLPIYSLIISSIKLRTGIPNEKWVKLVAQHYRQLPDIVHFTKMTRLKIVKKSYVTQTLNVSKLGKLDESGATWGIMLILR